MKNISTSISKILLFSFVLQILFPYFAWAQVGKVEEIRNPSFRTGSGGAAVGTGITSGTAIKDDSLLMGNSGAGGASSAGGGGAGGGSSLGSAGLIYQIHILGEVNRPGTYRIPASSRLYEALQMAGGLRANGSEREIAIRKPGVQKKVDLFAYKFQGSLDDNPYLMDNDVVFIPIRKKVVEIEGSVYRPGVYELKTEKNISDLLKLAGGYTQGYSANQPLKVIRYIDEKKQLIDVSPEETNQFKIESGDVIVIPHLFTKNNSFDYNIKQFPSDNIFYPSFEDRVFLTGGVQSPGAYAFNPNYKLGNYLAIAGGTTKMSKKEIRIVDNKGKVQKVKMDSEFILNPGDVVYVPEKRFTPEAWLSLLTGIVGFGLSTTATVLSLKNATN